MFRILSTTEQEVGIISPSGGSVASYERKLAIDEGVPGSSDVPNLQFFTDFNVVTREGEECLSRALAQLEASVDRAKEAREGDSFVDIMGGLEKTLELNQKDSHLRTFCNVQNCCQRLCWRVWLILLICHCVSLYSSYSFCFYL